MNPAIRKLHEAQLRKDLPEFRPGDTVRVNVRLKEGEGEKEKERLQAFEGVVISKKGRASSATFTVRRVSFGVGIERIFPLHSPTISSIEVVGKGRVRRARLYYLRDLRGKAAASGARAARKRKRPPPLRLRPPPARKQKAKQPLLKAAQISSAGSGRPGLSSCSVHNWMRSRMVAWSESPVTCHSSRLDVGNSLRSRFREVLLVPSNAAVDRINIMPGLRMAVP